MITASEDMFELLFLQIAVAIVTAGVVALLIYKLKQPLIIAYILTGLIVGPAVLGFTSGSDLFSTMSQIGIAFLLFLVGLNLNWRNVRDVGPIALLAGLGQVGFTTLIGFLIARSLAFATTESLLLGFALALSSTIVIVKLLSDKEDLDRLYGRISVGILLVQDLIAIVALLGISAVAQGGQLGIMLAVTVFKGAAALLVLLLIAKYVLPSLIRYAAQSSELLFMTALAWCFAVASGLHLIGFGIEIGALLAGISLAGTGFEREIGARVKSLRDFFLVIFFIVLGTNLSPASFSVAFLPALIFSAFVLVGNPLIVVMILRACGHHPRTGFLVGTTMAQVSEFAFIILAAAAGVGLVDVSVVPMVTLVAVFTIGVSSYLIKYNEALYEWLSRIFGWLDQSKEARRKSSAAVPEILLLGYHRMGESILPAVQAMRQSYLVVDVDPLAVQELNDLQVPTLYGDAGDEELLESVDAARSKLIISTIPDANISADILEFIAHHDSSAAVVVTVKTAEEAARMYSLGATFVIVPSILGGKLFADLLKKKKTKKSQWGTLAKEQKLTLGLH
jgi:Kef-type K+ transport system membrane component KefB